MRVSSVYEGFVQQHSEQVALLKRYMEENALAESVYLLGVSEITRRTETLFTAVSVRARWLSHYYLLAVVPVESGRSLTLMQDKMENRLRYRFPATVIVLTAGAFELWAASGHAFPKAVLSRSELLAGKAQPVSAYRDDAVIVKRRPEHVSDAVSMVEEFVAGGVLYRKRRQYGLAGFLLHQAAEHGLQYILRAGTGLNMRTHNLGKLVRYCCLVDGRLQEIFIGATEASRAVFKKLQCAYIDGRYKKTDLTLKNLLVIEGKIAAMKDIMERIGGEGIAEELTD